MVICLASCRCLLRALAMPGPRGGPHHGGDTWDSTLQTRGQALLSCLVGCVTGDRSPLRASGPPSGGLLGRYCEMLGPGPAGGKGLAMLVVVLQAPQVLDRSPPRGPVPLLLPAGGGHGDCRVHFSRASPSVGRVGLPARPGYSAPSACPSTPAFSGPLPPGASVAWGQEATHTCLPRATVPRMGSRVLPTAHGLTARVITQAAPSL